MLLVNAGYESDLAENRGLLPLSNQLVGPDCYCFSNDRKARHWKKKQSGPARPEKDHDHDPWSTRF